LDSLECVSGIPCSKHAAAHLLTVVFVVSTELHVLGTPPVENAMEKGTAEVYKTLCGLHIPQRHSECMQVAKPAVATSKM